MAQFTISPEVFQRVPGACFGAVVAKGIDNTKEQPAISALLDKQIAEAFQRLEGVNLKEYPAIVYYREAFQGLGLNPNKFMNSVEALNKRIQKGATFPKINPIVDIGNAMSLKYTLPMGAHDIRKLSTNLDVRFSVEGDTFVPFGETEAEVLEPGELVYASDNTVKTRRWIWRQSDNGKIDETSTDVIFPIDGFKGKNDDKVIAAGEELAGLLKEILGCEVKTGFLDETCMSIEL